MGRWAQLKDAHIRALSDVITSVIPRYCDDPKTWVESNLSMASSPMNPEKTSTIQLDPHQIEPFEAIFDDNVRSIVMCFPQQIGKSMIWQSALVTIMATEGITAYIVYESDEKAGRVNRDVLKPMMSGVPVLRTHLQSPKTFLSNVIRLPGTTIYYHGSGTEAASFAVRWAVASEVDRWDGTESRRRHVFNTLQHRVRRFEKLGISKSITESSPSTEDGIIWENFQSHSQGWWHLACLECGGVMRSCDIHHLQWECDSGGEPVEESIRLVCPDCRHEYSEKYAEKLNRAGRYIHRFDERQGRRSYQAGALAGWRSLRWISIAEKQIAAGKDSDYTTQLDFDNSVRGLPYQQRRRNDDRVNALKSHCAQPPDPDKIAAVYLAADTQDDSFFWIVRAVDTQRNTYLLDCGQARDLEELDTVWERPYLGEKIDAGIIDHGGHRANELNPFVASRDGMWLYKGDSRIGVPWKRSGDEERQPFLVLARAQHYQQELLYHIYSQLNRSDNYWFLPPEDRLNQEYVNQMQAVQPNKRVRNGHLHKNWEAPEKVADHFFDAEKMFFVLFQYMREAGDPELDWRRPIEIKEV